MDLAIIESKIYEIRGQKVMLDFDIAALYGVETRVLNQAVKRNLNRFPIDFMFQLINEEFASLKNHLSFKSVNDLISQDVISKKETRGGTQKLPFAFTEHGVTMLASVLKSDKAITMNIEIVRTFIAIKQYVNTNSNLAFKINDLKQELKNRLDEHDVQLNAIYNTLENLLDKKAEEDLEKEKWENRQKIGFKKK